MTIYTIYKATNLINWKIYIGFDSDWPARYLDHRKTHTNKNSDNYNTYFYCAIRKYGWDNFSWEIIYQSKDCDYTLNTMENYFIEEYRSYKYFEDSNGYNLTLGGEGTIGVKHSEEWKLNHSNKMKGRKFTEEHKQKISKALKGKQVSEITREKLRIANTGENNWQTKKLGELHPKSKKYIGVSPKGEIVLIHGMRQFCKRNNLQQALAVQCARNNPKYNYHKGWKFYYYDENLLIQLKEESYEN